MKKAKSVNYRGNMKDIIAPSRINMNKKIYMRWAI